MVRPSGMEMYGYGIEVEVPGQVSLGPARLGGRLLLDSGPGVGGRGKMEDLRESQRGRGACHGSFSASCPLEQAKTDPLQVH